MKKYLIILALAVLTGTPSGAFGRRNHATVAYIAEQYLTPAARKAVQEIFPGETLAEYASRADDDRLKIWVRLEEGEYVFDNGEPVLKGPDGKPFCYGASFKTDPDGSVWSTIPHGWLADESGKRVAVEKGECVWGAEYYAGQLKDWKNMPSEDRRLALHMVVHLIGDLHCPSHVHYTDARDRNDLKYTVIYSGSEIRYHNIWDTNILVDRFPGGPVDFGYYCDPFLNGSLSRAEARRQMKEIQAGTIEDWCLDVSSRLEPVFVPQPGDAITKDQLHEFEVLGREMVRSAGYRLAAYLNEIFK